MKDKSRLIQMAVGALVALWLAFGVFYALSIALDNDSNTWMNHVEKEQNSNP